MRCAASPASGSARAGRSIAPRSSGWRRSSTTAAPTAPASTWTASSASPTRRLAIVDPTPGRRPADGPARTAASGSPTTARSTTTSSSAASWSRSAPGFRTHTDTEVVLHAYATWGARLLRALQRHVGARALGRARAAARPRARPLRDQAARATRSAATRIASRRSRRRSSPRSRRSGSRERQTRSIASSRVTVPTNVGERHLLRGRHALCRPQILVFSRTGCARPALRAFEPGTEQPRADVEEQFRSLLRDAVTSRMRSDVPGRRCLSGGLDSSAIVGLLASGRRPLAALLLACATTIARIDESRYAELAAAARGDRSRCTGCVPDRDRSARDDAADRLAPRRADADARTRRAVGRDRGGGRHVKVVLDGQGGDELLAGYARFVFPYLVDRVRRPRRRAGGLARELPRPRRDREPQPRLVPRADAAPARAASTRTAAVAVRPGREPSRLRRRVDVSPRRAANAPTRARSTTCCGTSCATRACPRCSMPRTRSAWRSRSSRARRSSTIASSSSASRCRTRTRSAAAGRRACCAARWPTTCRARSWSAAASSVSRLRSTTWLLREDNWRAVRELLLDPRTLGRGILDRRRLERVLDAYERGPALYRAHRTGRIWTWITLELWFRQFIDA